MQVHIYIELSSNAPAKKRRKYAYLLECITSAGIQTRDGYGECEDTQHGAALRAVLEALNRITRKCEITIHLSVNWVANGINTQLPTWFGNRFLKADGKPMANQELLKGIVACWLQFGDLKAEAGPHQYTKWMQDKMRSEP